MNIARLSFLVTSISINTLAAVLGQTAQTVTITVDYTKQRQEIRNIGSSACWFAEPIGKYWPIEKKEDMARLLFSTETFPDGSPKGIGLSAFRFNIGGGTTEQGDSSGITNVYHRVECFLDKHGNYDWSKQSGYQWFLSKAKAYGVNDLIAFVNSPPVFFNENGLGYKLAKDYRSNLRQDKYNEYSQFLCKVVQHFDSIGLHFSYLSPVNEPQWDWSNEYGKAKQEGSPWTNAELHALIKELDSNFDRYNLKTKIIITEAATLKSLYEKKGSNTDQIKAFWQKNSPYYLGESKHLVNAIASHSYFTDSNNSTIVNTRQKVADTLQKYGAPAEFWQSEYCLLGNGYKENKESRSALDCGLFLAKIIHNDLVVGNATCWHYWNAFEPGDSLFDTRYYLFAISPNTDWKDGKYAATKNLYALGHYSFFIRPGMKRLDLQRSDSLDHIKAAEKLMVSGFYDPITNKLTLVAINYSDAPITLNLNYLNAKKQIKYQSFKPYRTDTQNSLKAFPTENKNLQLPPRSIVTFVSIKK